MANEKELGNRRRAVCRLFHYEGCHPNRSKAATFGRMAARLLHYVPEAMWLVGGLVEDFVDNMDAFDQDLLEDFTLVIGDGIEIA